MFFVLLRPPLTGIPIFEYEINHGELKFRWSNVINGFNMPIEINLDNIESKKLIDSLKWIKTEVDFVPFWSLMIDSKRIKSFRGDIDQVKENL